MDLPITKILLARQGIYNKNNSVFAYELLYRKDNPFISNVNNLDPIEGDKATANVITQLFSNLDIHKIIGSKRAFINFTQHHIIDKIPTLLPKKQIVIEVVETVNVDGLLINALNAMHEAGYKIALDDFIFREKLDPLIRLADFIKIDVLNQDKKQIAEQLRPLENFRGLLIAEKIENKSQFHECVELGFHYFQGFFLNKPAPLKGQEISEHKTLMLKLLAALNDEEIELMAIEDLILKIPTMSYRILRLANSASFYMGKHMETLMDAISVLGLLQIRSWISLLLLSNIENLAPDLLERTLIRAKMCECIAHLTHKSIRAQAYMVGILSTLDGVLNEPMVDLLDKIKLSPPINDALLHQKGELGEILKLVIHYENGQFNQLNDLAIENGELLDSYFQGIDHAKQVLNIIKN